MSVVAKQTSEPKELHPSGAHNAVLVDVTDPVLKETPWGHKEKIRLIFETDKKHPEFDGPFRVSKQYTLSLHEKSSLSKDLESWFGKSIPHEKRIEGIDLETLVGRRATVVVIHADDNQGTTWANISTLIPANDNNQLVPSSHYTREKDRTDNDATRTSTNGAHRQQHSAPTPQPAPQPAAPVAQPTPQPAAPVADGTADYVVDDLPF